MNKYFLLNYVNTLNLVSAQKLAKKFNYQFSNEEIELYLRYIKNKGNYLINNPQIFYIIHRDLDDQLGRESVNKFIELLKRLGF